MTPWQCVSGGYGLCLGFGVVFCLKKKTTIIIKILNLIASRARDCMTVLYTTMPIATTYDVLFCVRGQQATPPPNSKLGTRRARRRQGHDPTKVSRRAARYHRGGLWLRNARKIEDFQLQGCLGRAVKLKSACMWLRSKP